MELQGGEATLAFDRVTFIVLKAKQRAADLNKNLRIVLTTNLAHLTDEMLAFVKAHDISISTSLDGPAFIHNANRPRPGKNSHELVVQNLERCRSALGPEKVSAIMTTTHLSLEHPNEIIDEYVRLNLHAVFLRPISPYGFALRTQRRTGYDIGAFLHFYKQGLQHVLELNKSGFHLVEIYTRILLTKILTPDGTGYVDLQSPAGAGFNVLVYNYDGDMFLSDESRMLAEMGDRRFRIGSVHENRRTLFRNEAFVSALEGAVNQCVPGCSDCAFQTFCGADPIFHYATQGDVVGNKAFSSFCKRNMSVIEHIFELIRENDPETMKVFWAWLTNRPYSEMREELPA